MLDLIRFILEDIWEEYHLIPYEIWENFLFDLLWQVVENVGFTNIFVSKGVIGNENSLGTLYVLLAKLFHTVRGVVVYEIFLELVLEVDDGLSDSLRLAIHVLHEGCQLSLNLLECEHAKHHAEELPLVIVLVILQIGHWNFITVSNDSHRKAEQVKLVKVEIKVGELETISQGQVFVKVVIDQLKQ